MRARSLDEVVALYDRWADDPYDEAVSQRDHALQTAALAEQAGAEPALVVAALLHDVGHLLHLEGGGRPGGDERHELVGARYLAGLFGPAVTGPIALHVQAKRYLCGTDPAYEAALSSGSIASLARQGGPFDETCRAAFEGQPAHQAAVALRRWDDAGKALDVSSGSIEEWVDRLQRAQRA
jgi:phosphonate degradation associated HDIG domain protein